MTATSKVHSRHTIGLLYGALAYASFSWSDAFIKLLGGAVPPFQLMFLGGLSGLVVVPWLLRSGGRWRDIVSPRRPLIWLMRLILGALNTIGAIWAFERLSMPEAFALIFLMPIFVTLLSVMFLAEHVGWRRWLAVAAGFAGVLIVLRPGFRELNIGHFGALLAGLCGAASVVLVRKAGDTESRVTLFTTTLVGSIVIGGVLSVSTWKGLGLDTSLKTAAYGLLSAAGGLFLMMATLKAPVNHVAPIQYTQMLWAIFIGYFMFKEGVDALTWLGIAVILVAGLFTLLREEPDGLVAPAALVALTALSLPTAGHLGN